MPVQVDPKNVEKPAFDHCPKCGKQTFQVDKDKPIMAYD